MRRSVTSSGRARKLIDSIRWAVVHPRVSLRIAHALDRSDDGALASVLDGRGAGGLALELMKRSGVEDISFERDGVRWRTDLGDEIGTSLWRTGGYESAAIAAVAAWLEGHRGSLRTLVDLGANVGTTSLPFAQLGYHVYAVEPVPRTFRMLVENVEENGLGDQITCINSAVTSQRGHVQMWTGFGSGQGEVAAADDGPAGIDRWGHRGQLVSVPSSPLPALLRASEVDPDEIALVWADIQGSETDLIQSGRELWDAGVPLYVEVDPGMLELHGGLQTFVDATASAFGGFVPRDALLDRRPVPPIKEFGAWCRSIQTRSYSNALLLP